MAEKEMNIISGRVDLEENYKYEIKEESNIWINGGKFYRIFRWLEQAVKEFRGQEIEIILRRKIK